MIKNPVKKPLPDDTCLRCKHIYISMGEPGYSEYTPGFPASFSCTKGHWYVDDDNVYNGKTLEEKLMSFKGCKDREYADWFLDKVNNGS